MTANRLIDLTLEDIGRNYQPGSLPWMKVNRPDEWGKMLTLERRITGMALGDALDDLRGTLEEYQGLIAAVVKEFKVLKEEKGQGIFSFVERPKPPGRIRET
jgi:hypothetical protein